MFAVDAALDSIGPAHNFRQLATHAVVELSQGSHCTIPAAMPNRQSTGRPDVAALSTSLTRLPFVAALYKRKALARLEKPESGTAIAS